MAYKYPEASNTRHVVFMYTPEDDFSDKTTNGDQSKSLVKSKHVHQEYDSSNESQDDDDNEISTEQLFTAIHITLRNDYGNTLPNKFSEVNKPVDEEAYAKFKAALKNDDDCDIETESSLTHGAYCATCSVIKRVENAACFQKGMHIRMPGEHFTFNFDKKKVRLYSHHAIIKEAKISNCETATLTLIHFYKLDDEINICETTKQIDIKRDEIDIIEYRRPRHSPEEIVRRAESMLSQDNASEKRFGKYDVLGKNCEHFATWCVIGDSQSFQINGLFSAVGYWFAKLIGTGATTIRFIKRIFINAPDELAASFNPQLHIPGIVMGVSEVLYLLYCIGVTIDSIRRRKNKTLCKLCFKRKIFKLWAQFGAFFTTSGLCYILVHFALPLLAPGYGIPIMISLLILSLAFQCTISKLIKKLQSPLSCDRKPVQTIKEIAVGDVLEVPFWHLPHAVVVTEVNDTPFSETMGRIKFVHYGIPDEKITGTRQVVEEYMPVDTNKGKIMKLNDGILVTYSPKEVVERARMRLGERKWSPFSMRSDHLAYYAKVKEEYPTSTVKCTYDDNKDEPVLKDYSSVFVRESEVHERNQLQPGHIIKLNEETCMVLDLSFDDEQDRRVFEIETLNFKRFKSSIKTVPVNLDTDRILIQIYLEAHCWPMNERVVRARQQVGIKRLFFRRAKFFESLILKSNVL